jgi:hypothetical protein
MEQNERNVCVVCSKTLVGEVTVFLRVSLPISGTAIEGSMHVACAHEALRALPQPKKPEPEPEKKRIITPWN